MSNKINGARVPQKFSGIDEKLKRANQNIRNLNSEISRFFQRGKYCVLPEHNREILLKAIKYHRERVIPPRFSVLAGEIIHHLRSCFDHIAWHFSSAQYRKDHVRSIEFPIFNEEPVKKEDIARYKRKIKGITDPRVIDLIDRLQPYKTSDPANTLLYIIHDFDIVDKHRELVLCVPTGARKVPEDVHTLIECYERTHPEMSPAEVAFKFKGHGKLVPQISFRNFGRRTIQPVIPGLIELRNYTVSIIAEFAKL
jgi:hypothetical protein